MSRAWIKSGLVALVLVSGCAGIQLIGRLVSVAVPAEIPFPDVMTLQLGPSAGSAAALGDQVMGAMAGESIEQMLGRTLKQDSSPLRRAVALEFQRQLEDSKLFGSVVESGGNVGISVGISRWGLAYNSSTARLEPVLDIEATLSAPGLGVVWHASRSASDLSASVLQKASVLSRANLVSKPQGFNDVMKLAASDLTRQLVDDLRKNPPRVQ